MTAGRLCAKHGMSAAFPAMACRLLFQGREPSAAALQPRQPFRAADAEQRPAAGDAVDWRRRPGPCAALAKRYGQEGSRVCSWAALLARLRGDQAGRRGFPKGVQPEGLLSKSAPLTVLSRLLVVLRTFAGGAQAAQVVLEWSNGLIGLLPSHFQPGPGGSLGRGGMMAGCSN